MVVGQALRSGLRLLQAVAVHFPKQQRPILRADLPHLQRITRVGRLTDLEAVHSALGEVHAAGLRRVLDPGQSVFGGTLHSLKVMYLES